MAKEPLVVAQITVTPIGTSRADITKYIRKCIQIAHLSEMNFQETPLGTVIRGPLGEVMKVIRKMHEAPFERGVRRVRTQITIDDFRQEDSDSPLNTARAARELAIDQETWNS